MSLRIESDSTEYVKVPVTAFVDGAVHDPTADTVKLAFIVQSIPAAKPASGDWKSADWETISGRYYGRCLVGPSGTVQLAVAKYDVWVKVTDNPEIPIKRAGTLEIF